MVGDGLSQLFRDLDLRQEVSCHIGQRILWPGEEPIHKCVTDEAWEVTASKSKGVTSWRHAHNDVHVFTAAVHGVLPSELLGFREFLGTDFLVKGAAERLLFFFWEETRNHTDSKDVVNQLKEALLNNVSVSKQECLGLQNNFLVERLQINSKVRLLVVTDQVDGPSGVAGYKSSKFGQRLLAGTAETDEETATTGEADDSMDLGDVVQRVIEEHELHWLVVKAVVLEHALHLGAHVVPAAEIFVKTGVFLSSSVGSDSL